jgi:hypothetical protein
MDDSLHGQSVIFDSIENNVAQDGMATKAREDLIASLPEVRLGAK